MFVTVYATNGGLEFRGEGFELLAGDIKTAKTLNYTLQELNIDPDFDDIFFSSSMDFAEDEGFDTDDGAKNLWLDGVKQWELSSVRSA